MKTAIKPTITTKVATLALPTRETHVVASVWPGPAGMLLFLAELNLAPQIRQEFLQKINAKIETSWQTAKNHSGSADAVLESILLPINLQLANNDRLFGNPLSPRCQLLLAYLSGQQLALSSLGQINAFVISLQKINNILLSTTKRPNIRNISFENIISGELIAGETLLLASPALTDYFSWEKLGQLLADRPPGQALREIERYILQLQTHAPLGLIALKLSLTEETESTNQSINRLLQTKAATNSLLQPKLFAYLKNKLSIFTPSALIKKQSTANSVQPPVAESDKQPMAADKKERAVLSVTRIAKLWRRLAWLTNRESAKSTIAWWLESKIIQWRQLAKTKRALFLLSIALLIAFSQSIVNIGRYNITAEDNERYNQLVTKITEKQVGIESLLIYGDTEKAAVLYEEAQKLLDKLPRNSPTRDEQWQVLSNNLKILSKRLLYLNEITEPALWTQLPSQENWQKLQVVDKELLAVSQNKLLRINQKGVISSSYDLPAEIRDISLLTVMPNEILLITANNQAYTFNLNTNRFNLASQNLKIKDANFYQSGLYYLSLEQPSIWRITRQGNGFSSPVRWLRESQGLLTEAVGLAVDGAIYVALPNKVDKYLRGIKQDFTLKPVTPPLQSVNQIFTANDKDFLYLWEAVKMRLIVYDKSGKLISQITLPTLQNIWSVSVDGINKILFVAAGNNIYRVPILGK